MVRLIDHQQIPLPLKRLPKAQRIAHQKFQITENQLLGMKWIGLATTLIKRLTTRLIENGKMQIKAAQHLHQPLMNQALGHYYQDTPSAFTQQLLVQNQPRLDGLTQSHLIGQQHPGSITVGHLMGDIELMRDV